MNWIVKDCGHCHKPSYTTNLNTVAWRCPFCFHTNREHKESILKKKMQTRPENASSVPVVILADDPKNLD